MKKAILVVVLTAFIAVYGQGNWSLKGQLQDSYVFQFLSTKANTLFIAGSKIWKSTDGGVNWVAKKDLGGAHDIFFVNENVGWIAGSSGNLLKTNDAGETWVDVVVNNEAATADFVSVHFQNQNIGYISIAGWGVCKTIDGGQNWTIEIVDATETIAFQKITFCPESNSWFLIGNFGKMWRKTGTADWQLVSLPTTAELNFISFKGGKGYIASKEEALLLKSTDGGITWNDISGNMVLIHSMLHKHENNLMFGASFGKETLDGGLTFINIDADNNPATADAYFAYDGAKDYVYTSEHEIYSRDALVGIEPEVTPQTTELKQNYPNPFNPATTIFFKHAAAEQVRLAVYNQNGQLVKELVNQNLNAGNHEVQFNAANLNSGVYFYRLTTPTASYTQKMVLVK